MIFFSRNFLVLKNRNTGESGSDFLSLVPVAGVEPAPCRQDWILSPARLPIPSHRQNTSAEILPYLHDYFNPKYEVCGAILLIFTAYKNRFCRKSDISEISILLFCLISFDIYVKMKCEGR